MRPERAAAHLLDVVTSIDLIDGYLARAGPDACDHDPQLRDAVERRFGILAEIDPAADNREVS